MSLASRKRRHQKRAKWRGLLAIVDRTGIIYAASDVYAQLRGRPEFDGRRAGLVELVELPFATPGHAIDARWYR